MTKKRRQEDVRKAKNEIEIRSRHSNGHLFIAAVIKWKIIFP